MPENNDQASLEFVVNKYLVQIEQYIADKKVYADYADSSNTGTASLIQSARLFAEKSFSINNFDLTRRKVEAACKFAEVIKKLLPEFSNISKDTELQMASHVVKLVSVHISELHALREIFSKPPGSYDDIVQDFLAALVVLRTNVEYATVVANIEKNKILTFSEAATAKPLEVSNTEVSSSAPPSTNEQSTQGEHATRQHRKRNSRAEAQSSSLSCEPSL